MNKELLYTFFQGKTTLDEEVRIREWMESSPENYRTFLEERKLFDAMILLADENACCPNVTNSVSYTHLTLPTKA